MKQMKEEAAKNKQQEAKKNKEIAQLKKESRKRELAIRNMETEKRQRERVLKRKEEEVSGTKYAYIRSLIYPFHCHVYLFKLKFHKHEFCSATMWTPPLESTHRELSFEWSHL